MILISKINLGSITISDLKLYYTAIVIKTTLKQKVGSMESTCRSRNKSTQLWTLIFDKEAKTILLKRESFYKGCWAKWIFACTRKQIGQDLPPCIKLNSKWMKDLNIKPEKLNRNVNRKTSIIKNTTFRSKIELLGKVWGHQSLQTFGAQIGSE